MSVRLERGTDRKQLRSFMHTQRVPPKRGKRLRRVMVPSSVEIVTSIDIGTDREGVEDAFVAGPSGAPGGFVPGAAALNAFILTVLLMSVPRPDCEKCIVEFRSLKPMFGCNRTQDVPVIVTRADLRHLAVAANVAIGAAPSASAYSEYVSSNKSHLVLILLNALVTLKTQPYIGYQVVQALLHGLMIGRTTRLTQCLLVSSGLFLGTVPLIVHTLEVNESYKVAVVVWWLVGIGTAIEELPPTLRVVTVVLQMCVIWAISVFCLY